VDAEHRGDHLGDRCARSGEHGQELSFEPPCARRAQVILAVFVLERRENRNRSETVLEGGGRVRSGGMFRA